MTHLQALLQDLQHAQDETAGIRPCPACEYVRSLAPGALRDTLESALRGTIGIRKLEHIFQEHKIPVGRRTITRHRNEEHTP